MASNDIGGGTGYPSWFSPWIDMAATQAQRFLGQVEKAAVVKESKAGEVSGVKAGFTVPSYVWVILILIAGVYAARKLFK